MRPRAWLTWTDGRTSEGRASGAGAGVGCGRTTCANRLRRERRERRQHGAWLTAGSQATIDRSKIVACLIKYVLLLLIRKVILLYIQGFDMVVYSKKVHLVLHPAQPISKSCPLYELSGISLTSIITI